jgi:hypothetical protein
MQLLPFLIIIIADDQCKPDAGDAESDEANPSMNGGLVYPLDTPLDTPLYRPRDTVSTPMIEGCKTKSPAFTTLSPAPLCSISTTTFLLCFLFCWSCRWLARGADVGEHGRALRTRRRGLSSGRAVRQASRAATGGGAELGEPRGGGGGGGGALARRRRRWRYSTRDKKSPKTRTGGPPRGEEESDEHLARDRRAPSPSTD